MEKIPVNSHFLAAVKNGRRPGCYTTDRDCRSFAQAVLKYGVTLGDQDAAGLCQWVEWARKFPNEARHFLEQE
jgi:hypothetical protein